jgi:prolyl-tRNA editing enzyme YbaK/EbsC (Cys-tRNA(Pro) deacylase)
VAERLPAGGAWVETQVVLVDGAPAIACMPPGEQLSYPALANALGTDAVLEGSTADLPAPFTSAKGPVPPLGGVMNALTLVDEGLIGASALVFAAFSASDIVEIPYDELARLERPRIAKFALGGELPQSAMTGQRRRRSA